MNEKPNPGSEWFASWFDSPYYPLLYRHRNEVEAREFLTRLHDFLKLPTGSSILDLACGQGRHSRTLHALGYQIVGLDLSPASIDVARSLASPGQQFEIGDMRSFLLPQTFDAVVNLFTSFGYFSNAADNAAVLNAVYRHLNPNGLFVLDYLNAYPLLGHQKEQNISTVDDVIFTCTKRREDKCIVKDIQIIDGERHFQFQERVQLFTRDELVELLLQNGFQVVNTFGSYLLEPFSAADSARCLIIARKS